jgi:hypothetical protein
MRRGGALGVVQPEVRRVIQDPHLVLLEVPEPEER